MSALLQDVRFGLRMLAKNPGFTAVAVLTLALGIGANTAVLSVLNGFFLRRLPIPDPERIVAFSRTSHSWADYLAYRDQVKSFASLSTSYRPFSINLNSTRPPQHIYGEAITWNFLRTLGVEPALGRGFLPDEDQISSPKPVVILSYKLWRNRLGGDREILGKAIRLNNASYTVVGVMPSDLRSVDVGIAPDLWAPMAAWSQLDPAEESLAHPFTNPNEGGFWIFGRLRPGVSRQQAEAEVEVIRDRLHPPRRKNSRPFVELATAGTPPGTPSLLELGIPTVITIVAALVLLIACVNIANLLLARATSWRREIAIRLAIGASRWHIIRQLMAGNLLFAFLGAAAGLLLAWPATQAVASVDLAVLPLPFSFNLTPDFRVIVVTAGIAILTALLFGLAPAVRATRVDVNASLKDGDPTSTGLSMPWARHGLVMIQVAISVVVLVAAMLFLHSLANGFSIDLGFRPEKLLVVRVDPTAQGYSRERSQLFFEQLEERVEKLPGVRSASVVAPLPLTIVNSMRNYSVAGTSRNGTGSLHLVGSQYFETMGIPLIQGRDFRDIAPSAPRVAVIDHTMANMLFPNENPVGQQLDWRSGDRQKAYEVIGVVGDTKSKTIGEAVTPCIYELTAQNGDDLEGFSPFGGVSLVVKTMGMPQALAPAVQQEVERFDPDLPIYGAETMEEQVGKALVVARLSAWTLGAFGFLALALAAVGLYGLMSYSVAARTREIAIRMALGASNGRTLSLIARQGLSAVGIGLAVGLAAGLAVGRLLSSLLYGVRSFDPLTFVTVPVVLVCVAGIAILLPARRATKVDPMVALRHE